MHIRSVLCLSLAIIVAGTATVLGQVTVRPAEPPTPFSLIYSNQISKVATIACTKAGSPVEIPLWLMWEKFSLLKVRKGTPTVYETVGTFDKNAEKLQGEHFTAQGMAVGGALRIEIKYTTDGKTWQTRQFPSNTSLACP